MFRRFKTFVSTNTTKSTKSKSSPRIPTQPFRTHSKNAQHQQYWNTFSDDSPPSSPLNVSLDTSTRWKSIGIATKVFYGLIFFVACTILRTTLQQSSLTSTRSTSIVATIATTTTTSGANAVGKKTNDSQRRASPGKDYFHDDSQWSLASEQQEQRPIHRDSSTTMMRIKRMKNYSTKNDEASLDLLSSKIGDSAIMVQTFNDTTLNSRQIDSNDLDINGIYKEEGDINSNGITSFSERDDKHDEYQSLDRTWETDEGYFRSKVSTFPTMSVTINDNTANKISSNSLMERHYPRIVWFDFDRLIFHESNPTLMSTSIANLSKKLSNDVKDDVRTLCADENCQVQSERTNEMINDSVDILPYERPFYDQCDPMSTWQTQLFTTCNVLHEIDIANNRFDDEELVSLLSMDGSWRSVWKLQQEQPVVIKLLHYNQREFNEESFNLHHVDALAMERLTASPYVVSMYGFCGQSVATEIATGSPRTFLKNESLQPMERLRIARDFAIALSDIHSIDCDKTTFSSLSIEDSEAYNPNISDLKSKFNCYPSLAHNDMNLANVILVNGTLKMNDFNIGIFLRWNHTVNKPCDGAPVRFRSPLWKSPEEIRNVSYIDPTKADVYGLGNMLFQTLTKRQPWTHLEPGGPLNTSMVEVRKLEGAMPFIPPKYTYRSEYSKSLPYVPLYFAIMACFRYNPSERPTSQELAFKLRWSYHYLERNLNVISAKRKKQHENERKESDKIFIDFFRKIFDSSAT